MDTEAVRLLYERVVEFEDIIRRARAARYSRLPPDIADLFLEADPLLVWDLVAAFDAYVEGGKYTIGRLPGVLDRLIDTKLQFYFVAQVLPATTNAMVYDRGFNAAEPLKTPDLQLGRLCYSQALIGQSRVLWERLMRLILFLEENRDPKGKSTRRDFFRQLPNWSPRWDVLAEWEHELDIYDQQYRTPEYHKGSVLKRELLGGLPVDSNELLSLLTPVMNGLCPVMLANFRGDQQTIVKLGRKARPGDLSLGVPSEGAVHPTAD